MFHRGFLAVCDQRYVRLHTFTSAIVCCPLFMQVEKELSEICASILQLLDEHLIPTASTGESKVFYLKMKGDYHRYLAEFKTGADRKEAAEHTLLAYKAAQVGVGSGSAKQPQLWVISGASRLWQP
jgi:hypothetical protein